jgi:hypothetical protein
MPFDLLDYAYCPHCGRGLHEPEAGLSCMVGYPLRSCTSCKKELMDDCAKILAWAIAVRKDIGMVMEDRLRSTLF